MSDLIEVIEATDSSIRNRSIDYYCRDASLKRLLDECSALDRFRRNSMNLYERVRSLFFLYAIHRFYLPGKKGIGKTGKIPFAGYTNLLNRRFEESIELFLRSFRKEGPSDGICSALAAAYHQLAFQTLADQVRRSVRSSIGNQWMFRIGHPADYPLQVRAELLDTSGANGLFPVLHETTPVRMDLSHSGWSDIFFLGMDFPEGAKVLNVSIDLSVYKKNETGLPKPPVDVYFRVIDRPVIRLTSVDLETTVEISNLADVFDFAKDHLGLLKAAIIAAGIVPPGMDGADQSLAEILSRLVKPGFGIEIVSQVNNIPRGSRLAVSTTLLASLIAACMRATRQTRSLTGTLAENERRLVASRAILGEWLGGSGGGWQDSGGIWPGIKLIQGVGSAAGDPEFNISRGCLLPNHQVFSPQEISSQSRQALLDSLVLVHGGMSQDVGPILEMVTEKYLLRSEKEWQARTEAVQLMDRMIKCLKNGDIKGIGKLTQRNFSGPIQKIIPWADNLFTETLINSVKGEFGRDFHGFWMLGGMSGGGMGFIFNPKIKEMAQGRIFELMRQIKRRLEKALPFAIEPLVYNFAINEQGSTSEILTDDGALISSGYYTLIVPALLRSDPNKLTFAQRAELDVFGNICRNSPDLSGTVSSLFDRLIPRSNQDKADLGDLDSLLERHGFDSLHHRQIQTDLQHGRIGIAQNRLPTSSIVEDVCPSDVFDTSEELSDTHHDIGMSALSAGEVAVVSLAGGTGSRWTKGAGVVKSINPFCRLGGKHRTFIETHLAKSRRTGGLCGVYPPHIITTSYLTDAPIREFLRHEANYDYTGEVVFSPGRNVGLRLVPMSRDLRFSWDKIPQQLLDKQAQKVLNSQHAALLDWAGKTGEGTRYTDNLPLQCIHPPGHWYEVPNLLLNGVLSDLSEQRPQLKYLLIHNIDTLGTDIDPAILGYHIERKTAMTNEVIRRCLEDRGGGLARIDGRLRLVEGLALPDDTIEFELSYYNTNTFWVEIDRLLDIFGLARKDLADTQKVMAEVRNIASRMPTYITIKEVKKRWGKGQEDVFPVAQFEKLWGDMTALPELDCQYILVQRERGQQLKNPAQLDGWLRDGSAAYLDSICDWD